MTLQEFNGDFTKMHVILRFRVDECVDKMHRPHSLDITIKPITPDKLDVTEVNDDVVDVVTTMDTWLD